MTRSLALTLILGAALALTGCGASRAMRNSPDYQSGYSDGCDTANAADASHRRDTTERDESLYASSKAYRTGWGAGFGACRTMANPGGGPMQTGLDP